MKTLHIIAYILVLIGGLNWGLVGIGGESWNVVAMLGDGVASVVYILVGLSALFAIFTHKSSCGSCKTDDSRPASDQMM